MLFGVLALHLLTAAQFFDCCLKIGLRGAGRLQCRAQLALVLQRRQHEQLAGNELIAALLRQLVGEVEQPGQLVADVDIAFLPSDLRQLLKQSADALAKRRRIDLRLGQQRRGGAALLIEQRCHHVRWLKHVVVAPHGQRLRIGQRLLKTRSKFVHSHE